MKKSRFTLVELLVCVAVIAILVAMLMPVLGRVKRRARDIVCLNNLKQCSIAMISYASSNNNNLTPTENLSTLISAGAHYSNLGDYRADIVPLLGEYLTDFNVWRCPWVDTGVTIDAPANTKLFGRDERRGNYFYWGNIRTMVGTNALPTKLQKQSPNSPLLTDITYYWKDTSRWRVSHDGGTGRFYAFDPDRNPSFALFINGYPRGLNQVYADGHAKPSKRFADLKQVAKPWGDQPTFAAGDSEY